MTYEYGPWTEYTGEDLGDDMVQAQTIHMTRLEAQEKEPSAASEWNWAKCGNYAIHAYRKVLEPRVETIILRKRGKEFRYGLGFDPNDENFKLNIPLTQSGKLDFSRQLTWSEIE